MGKKKKKTKVIKKRTSRFRSRSKKPQPSHLDLSKESDDYKHILRICGKDIPGYMSLEEGLTLIYGVDLRIGKAVTRVFKNKYKKNTSKVGYLSQDDANNIEQIVNNLEKHVPSWILNRAKLRHGGKNHLIMADLQLQNRKDLKRLSKIKSYRGLRLQWGLPVRGQRTKSTFRKGSGAVGVVKRRELRNLQGE